jgi:PPOX class probable F420-dependent enzyme
MTDPSDGIESGCATMRPVIDPDTEFGARARRRLGADVVAWLTTTSADGTPQPNPVWFLWAEDEVLVYTQPDLAKVRNITRNPHVAVHLDGDGRGGDIVVLTGVARVAPERPPAHRLPGYAAKYAGGFRRLGVTPEQFAASYSVPLVVTPRRVRGH